MIDFFTPTEAVTMDNFNKRLTAIREAMPAQNIKIASGTYVGTDTYGAENPTTLPLDFAPTLLIVAPVVTISGNSKRTGAICFFKGITQARGLHSLYSSSQVSNIILTVSFANDGKTISWYNSNSTNPCLQLNETGQQYAYFAIGI